MSAPAGWYPTPDGRQMYWDGSRWTGAPATTPARRGVATWIGWGGLCLVAILGVAISIALAFFAAATAYPQDQAPTHALSSEIASPSPAVASPSSSVAPTPTATAAGTPTPSPPSATSHPTPPTQAAKGTALAAAGALTVKG